MREIKIVLTMDCEPTTATSHPAATGPSNWGAGEDAVLGYIEIAARYGLPVTFFVHPEAAVAQAPMFRELERNGACLGLHMHPWKYSLWRHQGRKYLAHYGGLSSAEQRELLVESSAIWADAIEHRPEYFRPGTFSANDSIFAVLESQGFRGGSCTAPGRIIPEMQAIWVGGQPDPHRAHPTFRQARGNLDFANMPLSADFSMMLNGPAGRSMYADFRPDVDWPAQYQVSYRTIATNILAQVRERDPAVPVLSTITHNHYAYRDANDPVTQRLRTMLDEMMAACHAAGMSAKGATLREVTEDILARPAVQEPFVCEGAIFDLAAERAKLDCP
jgi:peptidoglycan/xylan/chitin deacetylase (PgdA/CDA1 family)